MINTQQNQSINNHRYSNHFRPHTPNQSLNTNNNSFCNNQNPPAMAAILSLLQQIISLLGSDKNNQKITPNTSLIQFDQGHPEAITHDSNGQPLKSVAYRGDGFDAVFENPNGFGATGFGANIAAFGNDPRPKINNQFVIRADYTANTATYTLENGTTLTGAKPYIPQNPIVSAPTPASGPEQPV